MSYDVDLPQKSADALFADVLALLLAAQNSARRPDQTITINLINKARSTLQDALEKRDEETNAAKDADERYVAAAKLWLARAKTAEAELATLKHIHRAVEVTG